MPIPQSIQDERENIFRMYDEMRNYYGQDQGWQQLLQQTQNRASGQDVPFTPEVINAIMAQNADGAAGQVASEQDFIRQRMANSGLGGSGLETSAMVNARRAAQKSIRAGRQDITSRAQLNNYQAKTQAQQEARSMFMEQQRANAVAQQGEIGFRAQSRESQDAPPEQVQQQPGVDLAALQKQWGGPNPYERQLRMLGAPNRSDYQAVHSSYGGMSQITPARMSGDYEAAYQNYENRQQSLTRQAADWNSQRDQIRMKYGF